MGHSSRASHIPPTSSGGGGPADGNDNWPYIVVYDPDDLLTGDNRFTDWDLLEAKLATIDGPKLIHVAYEVDLPAQAIDLNFAGWIGLPGANAQLNTGIVVNFPEGCTVTNFGFQVTLGVTLISQATTHPTVDVVGDLNVEISDYAGILAAFKFFSFGGSAGNGQFTLANQGGILDVALMGYTVAGVGRVVYMESGYAGQIVILHNYGATALHDTTLESVDPASFFRFNTTLGTQMSQGASQVNLTQLPFNFSQAPNIEYAPGNSADWAGDPANVGAAIDRLAAVVAVLNGAPIP